MHHDDNQSGMDAMKEIFGEVIHSVTRQNLLDDGYLVDVTATAKQSGFRVPVALTRPVYDRYVAFDERAEGQSIEGRLWDVLWMLFVKIRSANNAPELLYKLFVAIPGDVEYTQNERRLWAGDDLPCETHREVTLKAHVGPGDEGEPVMTILLPEED